MDQTNNEKTQQRPQEVLETGNPFAKIDKMPRTPPRVRTVSLPDIGYMEKCIDQENEPTAKKKELESVSDTDSLSGKRKRLQENKSEMLIEILNKMQKQIKNLDKIVKGTYKPKTELQEVTSRLVLQAEKLQSKNLNEWLQNQTECNKEGEITSLQKENRMLRKQLKSLEEQRESEIQNLARCSECKKQKLKEDLLQKCKEDNSYQCYQSISEELWETEPFPIMEIKVDYIWEVPDNYDAILPCNSEFQGCNRQISRAIDRFGGKSYLLDQQRSKGQMAALVHQLGFPDQEGNIQFKSRNTYYPIITNEKEASIFNDEDMFNALTTVKIHAGNRNHKVVIPDIGGSTGETLKRMTQFLFSDTNVEVVLCKEKTGMNQKTNKNLNIDLNAKKATRTFKEDAILVKMEGKSYADLLRTVKKEVSPDNIGVNIKTVRKTRSGELLVTVPHGTGNAKALKEEIMRKVPGTISTLLTRKKVLHIKDLDATTTVEDVRKAISDTITVATEDLDIRALRPTVFSRQNVTVILPNTKADELLYKGSIKIGWTSCKVTERKAESKCTRCWEHTHQKKDCAGPDRSNLCMKCGKEGHNANLCIDKPYCLSCKIEGHQTNAYKCPSRMSKLKAQNEVRTD